MTSGKSPNIVFVLSDDQGAWAMGYAGNKHIITPNLDKLAAGGMIFDNSFCTSPVCSPARASILTGKMPSQHGVQDWIRAGHYGPDAVDYLRHHITLPEILKQNGYACAISGKWHLGDVYSVDKRFPDHCFIHLKGAGPYNNAPMVRNGVLRDEPGYVTDVITDDAIGYLNEAAKDDRPFYLSVHYTAPHNPWTGGQHPQKILDLYKDCQFEDIPQGFIHEDAIYRYSPEDAQECRRGYYAAITAMDQNIGRIMEELDRLGLRENTLVIFTSDNGFNCGHHGIWGKGNATRALNMFDTSVKVPLIVSQPGFVQAGVCCHEMVSQYDYLSTLLEYCGIENPLTGQDSPGKSFLPLLKGLPAKGHDSLVIYDEYGPCRMVRTSEWKYIHRYNMDKDELYHLCEDPNEDINLIGQAGTEAITAELKGTLADWFARYTDPVFDGSVQPVKGNGQINAIDNLKPGEFAFDQNRQCTTNPIADPSVNPNLFKANNVPQK